MATPVKPWPRTSLYARDDAIEDLSEGIPWLRRAVYGGEALSRGELMRCAALGLVAAQSALMHLESTKRGSGERRKEGEK
jgi:hypothetical protein